MDHTIVHFEIPANNVQKIKTFYENVLGWKIIEAPMQGQEYWLIHTVPTDEKGMPQRPGVNGGLYPRTPGMAGAPQINYISVENLDEYVAKVTKEGGKILVPKTQIPTVGWFAVATDPEGNAFGLLQPEMP
jgi:predicted enzyme related to lactoylglutathione lyase